MRRNLLLMVLLQVDCHSEIICCRNVLRKSVEVTLFSETRASVVASLAAVSANSFPLIPTWLGTQAKEIVKPSFLSENKIL